MTVPRGEVPKYGNPTGQDRRAAVNAERAGMVPEKTRARSRPSARGRWWGSYVLDPLRSSTRWRRQTPGTRAGRESSYRDHRARRGPARAGGLTAWRCGSTAGPRRACWRANAAPCGAGPRIMPRWWPSLARRPRALACILGLGQEYAGRPSTHKASNRARPGIRRGCRMFAAINVGHSGGSPSSSRSS